MKLDLTLLREVHPLLPESTAAELVHRAALALQRRHRPGVQLTATVDGVVTTGSIAWTACSPTDADQLDRHRVTEDGAEAVALSLVHAERGWTVRRRLQRGEHADWLLRDDRQQLVALEISGTDDGDDAVRMQEKLAQVLRNDDATQRAACVVRFREPRATLKLVPEALR
jgi:hypothetical protein